MGQTIKAHREIGRLDAAAIDRCSEWTVEALREAETDKKDMIRLRLAVEEALGFWLERLGEGAKYSFSAGTRFRRHYIEVRVAGEQLDPAEMSGEDGAYGGSLYSSFLSQAGILPAYVYRDGENCMILNPPRKIKAGQMAQLLSAITAAILLGLLFRLLPAGIREVVSGIITPLFDTMLGALRAISSPMIFLAICWGIISIGDVAVLGRIGRTVIGRMLISTFVIEAILAAGVMAAGLFSLGDTFEAGGADGAFQIYEMILDIVPGDILSPFMEGNALQIIFLGVCVGIAVLVLGKKASAVTVLIDQMNGVVQFLMAAIGKLVPLFVFFSIFSIISSGSVGEMGGAVKCIPLTLLACVLCAFIYALIVSWRLKVSLPLLLKKLFPTFLIGLTTASSVSAYGTNLETCEQKLGISGKIINFALPLGQVIFMPGAAVGFFVTAMCMAENSGISMTVSWLVINVIVCSLLSVAAAPVPGSSMTCYTIIFTQLGIPLEALPLAIAVNLLLEFPMTAVNLSCLQSELTLASAKLEMLDYDCLRSTKN